MHLHGPDFVKHDPPAHDCADKSGVMFWEADAWMSRGSVQRRCPRCRLYYWTQPTKPLADARP